MCATKVGGAPVTVASAAVEYAHLMLDDTNVYTTIQVRAPGGAFLGDADILRVPIAGGATFSLGRARYPWIAIDGTNVYWTDYGGLVLRAPKSGGPTVTVASGRSYPWGLAVDDTRVYWTENAASATYVVSAPK
jgi:hypothetical protein